MNKELTDKINLFRILHGVDSVYISISGELFVDRPKKFNGEYIGWNENGQKWFEGNYKNGKLHGKCVGWHENGQKDFEKNFKNGVEVFPQYQVS